jgi:pimeloyl-ACP methyl ester carboxylesterase
MPPRPSAADEFGGAARLFAGAVGGVTRTAQLMHQAIARRSFGTAGSAGAPVKAVHDAVSELVYSSVRTSIAAGGAVVESLSRAVGEHRPRGTLVDSKAGQAAIGVLNGAFGEHAALRGDVVPEEMTLRVAYRAVPIDALAEHFLAPSGRLFVFLHGLIETERWWFRAGSPDFGSRLVADLGGSAVYLRYNSGRHISDNGRELVDVLSRIVDAWPVEVTEVVLIGHSMGGLVARSALHQAANAPWLPTVSRLVCLGAPHTGAPLERGANAAAWALGRFAESAPLGELLRLRSSGVKDLRHGDLHEALWAGQDLDTLWRSSEPVETVLPPGIRQYFLAVTLARTENSLLARAFGDLLVMPASAGDATQTAERRWLGGMNHFAMLSENEVYETILSWLEDC